MPTLADAKRWFLPFSSDPAAFGIEAGSGRPWGDGTAMAGRDAAGKAPWDEGCGVTALIGGYETLSAMVEDLETAIGQAPGLPEGGRGHVYIAGWRLDPLRDLSSVNSWSTRPWPAATTTSANVDQTTAGLVLRMMQAGIRVRIMVWYPVSATNFGGFGPHIDGHFYLARLARQASVRLGVPDRGIVALDIRVAGPLTATHHQKTIVIRVGTVNVAYCGGVDWAYTRRDAPDSSHPYDSDPADPSRPAPQFLGGDWQSGTGMPRFYNNPADRTQRWPRATGVDYTPVANVGIFNPPASDLPAVYGPTDHLWHDQHLRLEGPIVKTLEEQFRERWRDSARGVHELGGALNNLHIRDNQVLFSSGAAIGEDDDIVELGPAADVPAVAGGTSFVQMWRTIPLRARRRGPFQRGEFTVMAGISRACQQARELIWIFDQYFFSQPLARLLNHLVRSDPDKRLSVIVVLPPFADGFQLHQHRQRKLALTDLTNGLTTATPGQFDRVAVFNLWDHGAQRGIYCHTKVQTYDRDLLVCGSANLNRRSFTCDTELNCAVLDPTVVDRHQQRLWKTLFPATPWPATVPFGQPGWGKAFLAAFKAAATTASRLIPDLWWDTSATITPVGTDRAKVTVSPPKLPNGTAREQDYVTDHLARARATIGNPGLALAEIVFEGQKERSLAGGVEAGHVDPSSVRADVETAVCAGSSAKDPRAPGRLDQIVFLLEGCIDAKKPPEKRFPWRRS
jgi:phosphatidylserine/phosphatidylglycerophosphate/cardiolipin synthase-like enzyme